VSFRSEQLGATEPQLAVVRVGLSSQAPSPTMRGAATLYGERRGEVQ
jgi:hypothetical protein